MRQDKLLTIRDVAQELNIAEKEVIDLAEQGKIPAYKIGGVYLRFRPEHIREIKQAILKSIQVKNKPSFVERLQDFFYFNDFYILSILIIVLMLIIILRI